MSSDGPAVIRFHLWDDEKTYWTLMVKPDTTADAVCRQIGAKVNNGQLDAPAQFTVEAVSGKRTFQLSGPKPLLKVQEELQELGSVKFLVRERDFSDSSSTSSSFGLLGSAASAALAGVRHSGHNHSHSNNSRDESGDSTSSSSTSSSSSSSQSHRPLQGLRDVKRLNGRALKGVGNSLKRRFSLSLRRTSSAAGNLDSPSSSSSASSPKRTSTSSVPSVVPPLSLGARADTVASGLRAPGQPSPPSSGRSSDALSASPGTDDRSSSSTDIQSSSASAADAAVPPTATRYVQTAAGSGNTTGWLNKAGRQRFFVLDFQARMLLWYNEKVVTAAAAAAAGVLPRGSLTLLRYTRAESVGKELRIWAPDEPRAKPYFMEARNEAAAALWVDALQATVKDAKLRADFADQVASAPAAKNAQTGGGKFRSNSTNVTHSNPSIDTSRKLADKGRLASSRGSVVVRTRTAADVLAADGSVDPAKLPGYEVAPCERPVCLGAPNAAAMRVDVPLTAETTAFDVVACAADKFCDRGVPVTGASNRILAAYKARRQTDLSNATLRMRQFRHVFSPMDRVLRMVAATDAILVIEEPVYVSSTGDSPGSRDKAPGNPAGGDNGRGGRPNNPLRTISTVMGASIFDQSRSESQRLEGSGLANNGTSASGERRGGGGDDDNDGQWARAPAPPPAPNDDLADLLGDPDNMEPELLLFGGGENGATGDNGGGFGYGSAAADDADILSALVGGDGGGVDGGDSDDDLQFGRPDDIATFMHREAVRTLATEDEADMAAGRHFDVNKAQQLTDEAHALAANEKRSERETLLGSASEKRRRIVQELYETEQKYVANLEFVIARALQPLRDCVGTKHQVLTKDELQVVFGNIESIHQIALVLLDDLRKLLDEWTPSTCVSSALLQLAPYMQSYSDYNQTYESANSLIGRKSESNKVFRDFLLRLKDLKGSGQLDLPSLLIMPIQRLPRYVMLLEQLIRRTPEQHPDFAGCNSAISVIRQVTSRADRWVTALSQQQQLMRIVRDLGGGADAKALIAPHRQFVLEAPFTRLLDAEGKKTTRHRLYLFNDVLVVSRGTAKSPAQWTVTGSVSGGGGVESEDPFGGESHVKLPLHLCWIKNMSFTSNMFEVLTPKAARCFLFRAPAGRTYQGQRDEWVARLAELTQDGCFTVHQKEMRARVDPGYDVFVHQLHWDSAWTLPVDPRDLPPRPKRTMPAVCETCKLKAPNAKIVDGYGLSFFVCKSCCGQTVELHLQTAT